MNELYFRTIKDLLLFGTRALSTERGYVGLDE